ncbi:unnamed protein product, partial [Didymodactylos carnosus]
MLAEYGVQLESIGGDVIGVPISALKSINIDKLLEAILTVAELQDLKGDPGGPVEGTILESRNDTTGEQDDVNENIDNKGNVATVLVQRGSLKKGTILVAGKSVVRVRALYNEKGNQVEKASLSIPVVVSGWKTLPCAGDEAFEVESENFANRLVAVKKNEELAKKMEQDSVAVSQKHDEHLKKYREDLERRRATGTIFRKRARGSGQQIEDKEKKLRYTILLKSDVYGTLEALMNIINKYRDMRCPLDIVNTGVGPINDEDLEEASLFG